jgi:hypothetical protein
LPPIFLKNPSFSSSSINTTAPGIPQSRHSWRYIFPAR